MNRAFGFSEKWIIWIKECVETAHADVLVNGSPSGDFKLGRGLRQGDPLSPFLFIIAAEIIGVLLRRAISCGMFQPLEIGPTKVTVSHLQFADDTLFLGKASLNNAIFLRRFLTLLEGVSGLRINKEKCQVISIKAENGIMEDIAHILRCKNEEAPFKYLGVMVGCRHRKIRDWNYVIEKVRTRLSKWSKLKVSLGGRITLIKSVLSTLPVYVLSIFSAPLSVIKFLNSLLQKFLWGGGDAERKLIWAKWDSIIVPKIFGGLGVRDLVSFNKALLSKWAWRAIQGGDWLWLDILKGVGGWERGRSSGFDKIRAGQRGKGWWGVVCNSLQDRVGNWFGELIKRKVGAGQDTLFWEDPWIGNSVLKSMFPRLFGLCLDKKCTVAEAGEWVGNRWEWRIRWRRELRDWENDSLLNLTDLLKCRKMANNDPDSWEWNPETKKIFTVKSAYNVLLNRKVEAREDLKFQCRLIWGNIAIPKVQATAWRVLFRRIATRTELQRRGVLHARADISCHMCAQAEESANHLFLECSFSAKLWNDCLLWIGIQAPMINDIPGNLLQFCSLGRNKKQSLLLASLWSCTIWMIWKTRNDKVFNNRNWRYESILGEIKAFLWNWAGIKSGFLKSNRIFRSWCNNPWDSLL